MEWDRVVIALLASLAAVIVGTLLNTFMKERQKNKWRKVKKRNIPIWLMYRLYNDIWSKGRKNLYGQGFRHYDGTYYEYTVKFKERAEEPTAALKVITVYRRVRPEKLRGIG